MSISPGNSFYSQAYTGKRRTSFDSDLRDYIKRYQALTELYEFMREAFSDRVYLDRELSAKTKELLRQHASSSNLALPGAIHELGLKELALLKQSDTDETTKILNLRKILTATVDDKAHSQPFLLSIGERAIVSGVTSQQAQAFNGLFASYPDYRWNEQQQKKPRSELYKVLLPLVGSKKMVDTANSLLRLYTKH